MKNKPGTFIFWITVFVVFVFALILNLSNNHFPLGYHFDEPKKVRFILTGEQDFHHPILMLELRICAGGTVSNRRSYLKSTSTADG